MDALAYLIYFISILCNVLIVIIFIRAILSWFDLSPRSRLRTILDQVTEPLLAPLRRIIPRTGMFDFTPLIAIVLLELISQLVPYIIYRLF